MDEFAKWATGICISSAVVCIVEMFISDMALEKTVRYVLGGIMLCTVILPLGSVIGEFRADIGSAEEFSGEIPDKIAEQRVEYLESEIKELVKRSLGEENIFPLVVEISMDIDEDNCINMIKADVVLESRDKVTVTKKIISELGIECNISVSG